MSDATDKIAALCAKATADAHGNADLMGELIERLLNASAFAIAMACRGDQSAMDEMLTGAESYLVETAVGYGPMAEFMR